MQRRIEWEKIKLDDGKYESAGVFDVNNNGILDIVCGGYWYEGPDYKKHKLCDVPSFKEWIDDFATIPLDVNGNGYLDYVTGENWGKDLVWRENPKGKPEPWKTHVIDVCGAVETTRAWDIDGDGEIEIFPNTPEDPLCFYKLQKDSDGNGTGKFNKYVISEDDAGHGVGFGDIYGDGTMALVTNKGWYEMPADPYKEKWKFHDDFYLGDAPSIPILIEDINEDGLPEIVFGNAHVYGLVYYQQEKDSAGKITWTEHPIDPYFSQYHDMIWADIDGDGKKELVTGNRYRAHCGKEPGETEVVGLYYFKFNGESMTKIVIDHGIAGQASGTGIHFQVVDLDGNGRLDIVAPGKEGLFIFKNLGPEQAGADKD